MEYEESDNYSYEDDFESVEPTSNKPSTKVSQERPPSNSLNYSFKDLTYKTSAKSYENSRSPNRPTSTMRSGKKNFQVLLAENKDLRYKLKKINEDLTNILSKFPKKQKKTVKPTQFPDSQNTRLQVYINEYVVLKNKVKKIMDPEHLIKLRNEIKEKETEILALEKEIKQLKKAQKNRDKNLEKFWVEDFTPNELTHFGHMNDQLFKYREQIDKLEAKYTKDNENYLGLQEKEEELSQKIEKLEDLWNFYNEKTEGFTKNKEIKDRVEVLSKKLKMIESKGQNRLSKLENQERVLNFEIEQMRKEKQNFEALIENKTKEAFQHSGDLQKVAKNLSQNDMGHLLGLMKINRSASPLVSQGKSPPPEEKKVKKKFEELFKPDKTNENSISEDLKPKQNLRKMMGNKPKFPEDSVIEEHIPEEEESYQPKVKLDFLNGSSKDNVPQFIKPIEKSSILKELKQKSEVVSRRDKPKSIFDELEADDEKTDNKLMFKKPLIEPEPVMKKDEKTSFFTELEGNSKENKPVFKPIEKSLLLMELESSPAKNENVFKPIEKSSFLMELEPEPKKNESFFKPIEKSSFFMDLEPGPVKSENSFKLIEKSSFLMDLTSEPTENKPDSFFKPIEKPVDFDPIINKNEFKPVKNDDLSFLSETEPKSSIFSKNKGRDRSHLFSKKEENTNFIAPEPKFSLLASEKNANEASDFLFKSKTEADKKQLNQGYLAGGILDKMKMMAERAEKHDFFGDFYDKKEEISFTGRLLPTKITQPSLTPTPNPPEPTKVQKPTKPSIIDLEEEDINL